MRGISDMINVSYIRQKEALGLGHAVLRAQELVGDEPFAVVLADDLIEAETPCLRQLLDVYNFFNAPVLAVMEVPRENISAYGVIDAEPVSHNGAATACTASATWWRNRRPRTRPPTWRSSAATC